MWKQTLQERFEHREAHPEPPRLWIHRHLPDKQCVRKGRESVGRNEARRFSVFILGHDGCVGKMGALEQAGVEGVGIEGRTARDKFRDWPAITVGWLAQYENPGSRLVDSFGLFGRRMLRLFAYQERPSWPDENGNGCPGFYHQRCSVQDLVLVVARVLRLFQDGAFLDFRLETAS